MVEQVNMVLADDGVRLLEGPVDGYKWPRFVRGLPHAKQDFLFECSDPKTLEQMEVRDGKKIIGVCLVQSQHTTPAEIITQIRETLAGIVAEGPGSLQVLPVL